MNVYRPEERRLVLRLMAYWDDLRGARTYPPAAEIDPNAIGDDWPNCGVLVLGQPLQRSTFEYVGAELLGHAGQLAPQTTLAEVPESVLLSPALSYLDRLLQKQVPISLGGEAKLEQGPALYRSILLPLSSDGATIDKVLIAANHRLVTADASGDAPDGGLGAHAS